jgi:hypothetical protein
MARLAYILAASHSGSTLLAMLLGAHPEAVTVGELKATNLGATDRYRCSCGALIKECDFWRRVAQEMRARGYPFDITRAKTNILDVDSRYAAQLLRPLHRGVLLESIRDRALTLSRVWRKHLEEVQKRNLALLETLGTLTGARVVVDSSKLGLRLKYLLRIPSLDVKVVRLIRDGRGVALTYVNPAEFADTRNEGLRGGGSGVSTETGREMRRAAREWKRSNEEADALLAGLPRSDWLEVRYEDLCGDPSNTLRAVCSFLGLDSAQIVLDFRSVEHHVVGNGMRLDSTSDVLLDERWKTFLSEEQLQLFESVAGDLNRRLGYP